MPVLVRQVDHVLSRRDTGAVDDDVDLPEIGDHVAEERIHGCGICDVHGPRQSLQAAAANLVLHRHGPGAVDIDDDHRGACLSEPKDARPADPAAAAGHHRDLVVHDRILPQRRVRSTARRPSARSPL